MPKEKATAAKPAKARKADKKRPVGKYEPPRLTKFDKLEKLIVSGE